MSQLRVALRSPTFALTVAGVGLAAGIIGLVAGDLQDLQRHGAALTATEPAAVLRAEFGLTLAAIRVALDVYLLAVLGLVGIAHLSPAWIARAVGAFVAAGLLGVGRLVMLQVRLLAVVMLRLTLRLVERLLGFEVQGGLEAAFFVIAVALAFLGGIVITTPTRLGATPARR